ncbi:polysaccharide biosynthesis/export family protein [Opitutus sp. ER46]|uniref:polysaccharide biosynthesis/export family protein n=1 Tax=Opitutus sp. ER46 TaxID=2161864 RepID=UPI000D2FD816|nr:polysaccharide biosynthesis/export family protein [Opitutus sp. ER46]PTX91624.1 sugar transporter [Opitutus sp. ER46]
MNSLLRLPALSLFFCLLCTAVVSAESAASARAGKGTKLDYILQPQDVVKVQVFQEDDINKQGDGISISQKHTISLPLIGEISLRGKTVREAEEIIRELYDKDYIVNPQVSVTVLKYAERTVNVIGSVTNQGRIQFPQERGLSIVDAISLAGGQTRLADLKRVKLSRKNDRGDTEVMIVDVDAMMKTGGTDQVVLEPDDVIFVPERIL